MSRDIKTTQAFLEATHTALVQSTQSTRPRSAASTGEVRVEFVGASGFSGRASGYHWVAELNKSKQETKTLFGQVVPPVQHHMWAHAHTPHTTCVK